MTILHTTAALSGLVTASLLLPHDNGRLQINFGSICGSIMMLSHLPHTQTIISSHQDPEQQTQVQVAELHQNAAAHSQLRCQLLVRRLMVLESQLAHPEQSHLHPPSFAAAPQIGSAVVERDVMQRHDPLMAVLRLRQGAAL